MDYNHSLVLAVIIVLLLSIAVGFIFKSIELTVILTILTFILMIILYFGNKLGIVDENI
jgi:hypothetical protein